MRKLFLIAFLFLVTSASAQYYISIRQDVKLLIQDTPYTKALTPDIIIDFKYVGYDRDGFVNFSYEIAGLKTTYHRLSIGGGMDFSLKYGIHIQPEFGFGFVYHNKMYYNTPHFGLSLTKNITERLLLGLYGHYVYRPDINQFRYSNFLNISYKL